MSFEDQARVRAHSQAKGPARNVLDYIAQNVNHSQDSVAWPAVPTIADVTGFSKSTVKRAITKLEQLGELRVVSRKTDNGASDTHAYRVALECPPGAECAPKHYPQGDPRAVLVGTEIASLKTATDVRLDTNREDDARLGRGSECTPRGSERTPRGSECTPEGFRVNRGGVQSEPQYLEDNYLIERTSPPSVSTEATPSSDAIKPQEAIAAIPAQRTPSDHKPILGDKASEPSRWASLRSRVTGHHKRDAYTWARAGHTEWTPNAQRNASAYPVGFLAVMAAYPRVIEDDQQAREAASAYWQRMKDRTPAQQANIAGVITRDALALRIAANYRLEQDAPGTVHPIIAPYIQRGYLPSLAEWLGGDLVNVPAEQILAMIPSNDQARELREVERITSELLAIDGLGTVAQAA